MTRPDVDLKSLIGPAIAALIGAVLLAVAWQIGAGWLDERGDAFRRARAELARTADRYRNASDDQQVYEEYAARFLDMRARGWIGPEDRLGWIEALQRINADLQLPTLGYDIGEQAILDPRDSRATAHLELRRTPMTLRLGALHEGDVVELLSRLQEVGHGLMSVERCAFSRASDPVRLDGESANVDVECALDWYMLRMKRRKERVEDPTAPRGESEDRT